MMKKLFLFSIILGNLFTANSQSTCATATPAVAGLNTVSAISGTLVDGCGETSDALSANWFVYSPTISGIVTITSNLPQNDGNLNSDDTFLNVYTGTCGTLTCFASNDDEDLFGGIYLSTVSFIVQPGETYYLEWADEWYNDGFDFQITETIVNCPASVTPPFTGLLSFAFVSDTLA